jgi:hypothetical protein
MNRAEETRIAPRAAGKPWALAPRIRLDLQSPWLWLCGAALLALICLRQILKESRGLPSVPLDDAYIHFQYARSLLRGTPFAYTAGAVPAPGATSLLWPMLLAPFHAIGFRDSAIIWVAWALGFVALGLLARETYLLARAFLSQSCALAAGLATFAFAANAWFASSGMEVVPLAWLLTRSSRRAADWAEGADVSRTELIGLAWLSAMLRPEGALAACMIACVLGLFPRTRHRSFALLALAGIALSPCVNWLFTGQAAQTTSRVKWLPFNPYFDTPLLLDAVLDNIHTFVATILNGELWSSAFIPEGSRFVALFLLPAALLQAAYTGKIVRGLLIVALGLGMLIPTTYDSFLWNRLRYLWPFSAAWLLGIAALAELLGTAAARWHAGLRLVRTSFAFGITAVLATKLPFAIQDLALSSDAITSQQVSFGRWAREALPESALIGVNDTGAIAYFSERRVFDVVGLTTRGEAKYWVAGAGSRFEHYERLERNALPTHYIVYPEWFGVPWLMSPCLTERFVPGRTILGGERMLACAADYSALGSGALPMFKPRPARPLDVVDVADLESEAAHDYVVLPAKQHHNVTVAGFGAVDGARLNRTIEGFEIKLSPNGVLIARLGVERPLRVRIEIAERFATDIELTQTWEEPEIPIPSQLSAGRYRVTLTALDAAPFTAFHYWSYEN